MYLLMQNILVHQETDKFKVSWEMSQTVHQPSLGQTSPPHIRERIKDNKNAKIQIQTNSNLQTNTKGLCEKN